MFLLSRSKNQRVQAANLASSNLPAGMDEIAISRYLSELPGVESEQQFGYTFFFHGSDHKLPFVTLASADNEYDRVSNLDRPGVFRLNIGIAREKFRSMFGAEPVELSAYDFTALDVFMPHPHYAAQHFICVLSPGVATSGRVPELLKEAHDLARQRQSRR